MIECFQEVKTQQIVQAVCWDGICLSDVLLLTNNQVYVGDAQQLILETNQSVRSTIHLGDYIVKDVTGTLRKFPPYGFHSGYLPILESTGVS
jgi:hypothetical protein